MIEDELYAVFIFDHARTAEMVSEWYKQSLDVEPEHVSVFAGTKYDELAKVGPQLLYTIVDSELYELGRHQIVKQGEGVIFYTHTKFPQVCEWASSLVAIKTEHGGALFRFYEPSIIDVAEEALGNERWWALLPPIAMIENFTEGQWASYKNSQLGLSSSDLTDAILTTDDLDRLSRCREYKFYQKMVGNYQQQIKASDPITWVSAQCSYAKNFQLETQYLQEQWIRAALINGDHFYQHQQLQSVLKDVSFTAMRKWKMIESLLPSLSFEKHSGMNYVS